MRRAVLILLAAAVLSIPAVSRADDLTESPYPDEYTQEDSQPLRFASYFVTPMGFLLEWTVMRPIHFVATSRFLAPIMDSEHDEEGAPAPVAELPPPDYLPSKEPVLTPPLREETIAPAPRSPAAPPAEPSQIGPAIAPEGSSQSSILR